jgi:LacI family transcriptional regulator
VSPLTIEQIASLSGVSRSTVSRVVNNHPRVSPHVRARVRRVIEERGYAPNAAARSLAASCTNVICLLIVRGTATIFTNQYFPPLVQGISEACNECGYYLMLSMVKAGQATSFYQRVVNGRHCDGIVMLANDVDPAMVAMLLEDGTPYVLIGSHPAYPELNSVDVENFEGARLAVRHLLSLGHRRIATISGRLTSSPGAERYDGYVAAMQEAGLPIPGDCVAQGDLTGQSGYLAMRRLLQPARPPTAVFAADDAMAGGALRAIHEAGLSVPGDIALVGFDDVPVASLMDPQLTTIRQPIHQLGAQAARVFIDQLRGRVAAPVQQRLPVELVIRQSCGAPVRS